MKITFAGYQFTDWNDHPAMNVRVNGQAVYDTADIIGAAQKKFYFRGNEAIALEFSVRREFDTLAEAQIYLLTHFSTLTKQGTCSIVCGGPGDDDTQIVTIEDAILAAVPEGIFNGVEVIFRYTIVAAKTEPIE